MDKQLEMNVVCNVLPVMKTDPSFDSIVKGKDNVTNKFTHTLPSRWNQMMARCSWLGEHFHFSLQFKKATIKMEMYAMPTPKRLFTLTKEIESERSPMFRDALKWTYVFSKSWSRWRRRRRCRWRTLQKRPPSSETIQKIPNWEAINDELQTEKSSFLLICSLDKGRSWNDHSHLVERVRKQSKLAESLQSSPFHCFEGDKP